MGPRRGGKAVGGSTHFTDNVTKSSCTTKIHRQFPHLENSSKITDILTSRPVVRNHNSFKLAEPFNAARKTTYRSLSPGSTGSSSSATHTIPTLRPASTRSESTNSRAWRDPSPEPAETENTNQNVDNDRARRNPSRRCLLGCPLTGERFSALIGSAYSHAHWTKPR